MDATMIVIIADEDVKLYGKNHRRVHSEAYQSGKSGRQGSPYVGKETIKEAQGSRTGISNKLLITIRNQ